MAARSQPDRTSLLHEQIEELIRLVTSPEPFAPIRASGIIRQFLVDSGPLVVQVRNQARMPLPIRAIHEPFPSIPLWFLHDSMNESGACDLRAEDYVEVLLSGSPHGGNDDKVSIREFISYVANVEGAVHAGVPTAEQAATAAVLRRFSFLHGEEVIREALRLIGAALIFAMQPARDQLMNLARFDGQPGATVAMSLIVLETDVEGDLDIAELGEMPGARLLVRDDSFRTIVRSRGQRLMVRGAFAPSGRPFPVLFEVATHQGAALVRVQVDGLDSVCLLDAADDWSAIATGGRPTRLGYSRYGRFAIEEWVVSSAMLLAEDRARLYDYLCAPENAPTSATLFAPGQGLEGRRDGSMHARDLQSCPSQMSTDDRTVGAPIRSWPPVKR